MNTITYVFIQREMEGGGGVGREWLQGWGWTILSPTHYLFRLKQKKG